jgi:hypothetical protein
MSNKISRDMRYRWFPSRSRTAFGSMMRPGRFPTVRLLAIRVLDEEWGLFWVSGGLADGHHQPRHVPRSRRSYSRRHKPRRKHHWRYPRKGFVSN